MVVQVVGEAGTRRQTGRYGWGAVINAEMIDLRAKTIGNTPDPYLAAVAQLVLGTLSAHVADEYGEPVSRDGVAAFWKRFKKEFSPGVQALEKTVDHQELFRIVFVMPEYANTTVHRIFATTEAPHEKQVALVTRLLTQAMAKPGEFETLAANEGVPIDRLWIGPNSIRSVHAQGPLLIEEPAQPEEAETAGYLYQQLGATRVGQVYTQAMATPDAFQLAKVEQRDETRVQVALMTIPKNSFDNWFWHEASRFAVEFADLELGRKFLSQVSWGKRMLVRRDLYPELFQSNP